MKSRSLRWLPVAGCLWAGACGGTVDGADGTTGETGGTGGATSGGATSGGATSGGATSGGATSGGATSGGATSGGTSGATSGGYTSGGTGGITTRPPADHRAIALGCVGVHDPPEPVDIWDPQYSDCLQHADCTDGENGKCISGIGMMGGTYFCTYDGCQTDADCDPGKICYCTASSAARCLSIGDCQTDADCGPGGYCSPSMSWDCGGYRPIDGYHCHTPSDTCIDDADCSGSDYCNFNVYVGHWECTAVDTSCVIG